MNQCPSCGADPGVGKFCQECGTALEPTCPSCGQDPGSGKFCQHCGTALDADPAPDPGPTAPPPPEPEPQPAAAAPQADPPAPPAAPIAAEPAKKSRWGIGCLVVALVLVGVVGVGGFFVWQWFDSEVLPQFRDTADSLSDATGGLEELGSGLEELETLENLVTIEDAPPGPCYDFDLVDGFVDGFDEVSCEGEREVEVAFASDFEPGTYPGLDTLNEQAEASCDNIFERYVGVSQDESRYRASWLVPTEEMWVGGNLQGVCLIVSDDGSPLSGTVKGSGA